MAENRHDGEAWPQAAILTELPPVARLGPSFDPDRLLADLRCLSGKAWGGLKNETQAGADAAQLGWQSLALRAIGGDAARTDAGGPGLGEFADTPLLAQTRYLAEVLASVPARLRGVRLLALRPGAHSPVHVDPACGLPWGTVRLHVPIVAQPQARLEIAGDAHIWQPGSFWYGDFTRPHQVINDGPGTRVHLVIDSHITPELLSLFPAEFRRPNVLDEVLFDRTQSPSRRETSGELRCEFSLPGLGGAGRPPKARIDWHGGRLAYFLDGKPVCRLVHVGHDEFRFAGWTTQQTLRVHAGGTGHSVTMFIRTGKQAHAVQVDAVPVDAVPVVAS
ncbi:MAG: aspartyl/asparaginyl beta-hydroxylase domain-containing protein [Streptosporangiaceae bacterium]|nr:aspartyl/asparaginyl beta-hydroxylase domain-containing protein [Streptosporangiaceae bacterium]